MTEQRGGLPVLAFRDGESFEEWLDQQPADAAGAWVKLPKQSASTPGMTKAEAIDAALCHGWIDGQLDKYDDQYWLVRFTPRKARSKWSQVNKKRATELIAEGRMRRSGAAQIEAARRDGRWDAAYAPASSAKVPADLQDALDANPQAAKFFATLKGTNRYAILYRIGSVKRPETRARKIAEYVSMLERGETIHG
ncbi:YdeI family protein [Sphingomonas limnosediminicola]|uniref:YdeI family protein n=1 Tax=Sphingomonas limnosediminicola TaxID=940133 RepID=A0ABP7LWM9_9SPHN